MSELLINGARVLKAVIAASREGAWTAHIELDTDVAPAASSLIDVTDGSGTVLLRGRVVRSEAPYGRTEVLIFGGAGKLGTLLAARYYRNATVSTILSDIARESESVLAEINATQQLDAWVRIGGEDAVSSIKHLLRAALPSDWVWRTQYDGSLWLGADTWEPIIAPEIQTLDRRLARGEIEITAETVAQLLAITPGSVFEGVDVSAVRIDVSPSRLRAVVYTHAQARTGGELTVSAITSIAREATIERALLAMYSATVEAQNTGTAKVNVRPDSSAIPAMVEIPLVAPYPGALCLFSAASIAARTIKVLVGFENGDPAKPYAVPWSITGVTPDRIEIDATTMIALAGSAKGVARLDDSVGAGTVTATTPSGPVTFVYTPQGGVPLPPSPTLTISGKITSASSKLKTG